MRTVTFLSSIIIAEAIRPHFVTNSTDYTANFLALVLVVVMFMDVIEFSKKLMD